MDSFYLLFILLYIILPLSLTQKASNNKAGRQQKSRTVKEKIRTRADFVKTKRAEPSLIHSVTISVAQNNLAFIEKTLLERSNPESPQYQNWLTSDEIGNYTRNDAAFDAISAWLASHSIQILGITPHRDYITASANISTWETALDTTFYVWNDSSGPSKQQKKFIRADTYSVPDHMDSHISAILGTCQVPPVVVNYGRIASDDDISDSIRNPRSRSSGLRLEAIVDARPSSLNSIYGITSNTGETLKMNRFVSLIMWHSFNDKICFLIVCSECVTQPSSI